MPKTRKTETNEAPTHPAERLYDVLIASAWGPALRFALDLEGASGLCRRRTCRKAGGCLARWKDGKPVGCEDASEETVRMAAALVHFGSLMVMRYLEDVAVPERAAFARRSSGGGKSLHGGAGGGAVH